MGKQKFKDQCDICGKFDYCQGFRDKVLCTKCLSKEKNKDGKSRKKR